MYTVIFICAGHILRTKSWLLKNAQKVNNSFSSPDFCQFLNYKTVLCCCKQVTGRRHSSLILTILALCGHLVIPTPPLCNNPQPTYLGSHIIAYGRKSQSGQISQDGNLVFSHWLTLSHWPVGSPASQNPVKEAVVTLPNGQRKKNGKGRGGKYLVKKNIL